MITGASSGIGAALTMAYAEPGKVLSLHGRNEDRLNEVAEKARRCGAEVMAHLGDVTDARDMAAWIVSRDRAVPLDLVIAGAGISAGTAGINDMAAQTKAIFEVNVEGVFNTIHPVLPRMVERKRGQIGIISSLAGFRGFGGASAYAASKAAVRVYGEGLRTEMSEHHIEINVICPGFVETPMTAINRFKMPFLMSPETAARNIRKDLERNTARSAFPRPMYAAIRLFTALPQALLDVISRKLPRK